MREVITTHKFATSLGALIPLGSMAPLLTIKDNFLLIPPVFVVEAARISSRADGKKFFRAGSLDPRRLDHRVLKK